MSQERDESMGTVGTSLGPGGSTGEAKWGGQSTSARLSRSVYSLLVVIVSFSLGGVPVVYR